jgi:hypothetical protein
MSSLSEIYNIALLRVAADLLVDPTDVETTRGRRCNAAHTSALPLLLTSYDWTFARKIKSLTVNTHDSESYLYTYSIPTACLKPIKLEGVRSKNLWVITDYGIETNVSPAKLRFTFLQDNPGRYSQSFAEALGLEIAKRIAPSQSGLSTSALKEIKAEAAHALALAQEDDANRGFDGNLDSSDPMQETFINPDYASDSEEADPPPWYRYW